jgi:hypothetical protein
MELFNALMKSTTTGGSFPVFDIEMMLENLYLMGTWEW